MKRKPDHFRGKNFDIFILECAIRDRTSYIDAVSFGYDVEPYAKEIAEAQAEIEHMRSRLAKLRNRNK